MLAGDSARQFEDRKFFKFHSGCEQNQRAGTQLIQLFQTLPAHYRSVQNNIYHQIIRQIPDECADSRKELSRELYRYEVLQQSQPLAKPPWTVNELIKIIAAHIECEKNERRRQPAKIPYTPRQSERGKFENDKSQGLEGQQGCVNCGDKTHQFQQCTKRCPHQNCKQKFCPGTVDAKHCATQKGKPRPTNVKNALGKPLPARLQKFLVNMWARNNGKSTETNVTDCTENTVPAVEPDGDGATDDEEACRDTPSRRSAA